MKKRIICIGLVLLALLGSFLGISGYLMMKKTIPTISFWGSIEGMESKSDVRMIEICYQDAFRTVNGFAKIKVQGTSSLNYVKKNYTIKLYEDYACEEPLRIDLGWGKQWEYCLKANWIDHTHARNVVTANLVSEIQKKYGLLENAPCHGAIDGFPVEIYSNDTFLGLYTCNIPKSAWQFGMDEENPDHIVICGEDWEPANLFKGRPDFTTWAVEVGEETEETLSKMYALFDFVMDSDDEEFKNNFEDHIDLDAALNYYILSDFAYLSDNRGKNMLLATYDGVKWYPSLYDLDTSWGTDYLGKKVYDYRNNPMNMAYSYLFDRMEQCFSKELAQRYFELKDKNLLTKAHVMALFNDFRTKIPEEAFAREQARWGDEIPGFHYDQIEEFLDYTTAYADRKYGEMLNNP